MNEVFVLQMTELENFQVENLVRSLEVLPGERNVQSGAILRPCNNNDVRGQGPRKVCMRPVILKWF